MGFDIDTFLSKHENEENKIKKIKNEKIDLSFQKEVEDKLESVQKKTQTSNFNFLEKAYLEVRKFDEDLTNKFLGIEERGNEILKQLGDKYSKEFLSNITKRNDSIENTILNILSIIDKNIIENNFNHAFIGIEKATKELESMPNQFFERKTKLNLEIKKKIININKKLKNYKVEKLKNYKAETNRKILELNQSLIPNNLNSIKEKIEFVNYFVSQIPMVFISELIDEKTFLTNSLIKAENYLLEQEMKEFQIKESSIEKLIEKFHKLKIDKKIDDILIIYNEIILEFQKLPDIFFEKKVAIFKNINNLYGSINSLIIKNNFFRFYEAFNYGKILEEIEEYFEYISKTKKVNKENLLMIEEKLKTLPKKYDLEKSELERQLNYLLKICNEKNTVDEIDKNIDIKTFKKENLERKNKLNNNSNHENENRFLSKLNQKKINLNLKNEIISYYKKLEKSNEPSELKVYYNKLIFYLKLSKLDEVFRKEFILNLNQIINSKKLNQK